MGAPRMCERTFVLDKMGREKTAPIVEKIKLAVTKVCRREGFSIILDKAYSPGLFYYVPELDLTEKVQDQIKKDIEKEKQN